MFIPFLASITAGAIATALIQLGAMSVWVSRCRHSVTITNFTGAVKAGDLLLVGTCTECRGDVARVVEMAGGALELGRVPKQLSVGAPQIRLNSNRFALSQNFHYGLVRWKGTGQILSEK